MYRYNYIFYYFVLIYQINFVTFIMDYASFNKHLLWYVFLAFAVNYKVIFLYETNLFNVLYESIFFIYEVSLNP